jgi:hypothetical protein
MHNFLHNMRLQLLRGTTSKCGREMGAEVDEVMSATSRLAEAQSMRQATSLQALPFVHWALLYIIAVGAPLCCGLAAGRWCTGCRAALAACNILAGLQR